MKILIIAATICLFPFWLNAQNSQPILGEKPQKFMDEFVPEPTGVEVEVWAKGLNIPWSLLFLPNGDALIAQRTGEIMKIPKGSHQQELYYKVPDVAPIGDSGLMGMALHPDFKNQPFIYIMYTHGDRDTLISKVVRLRYQNPIHYLTRSLSITFPLLPFT
jgi:glucose/arabinose dehydrogenase